MKVSQNSLPCVEVFWANVDAIELKIRRKVIKAVFLNLIAVVVCVNCAAKVWKKAET